MKKSLLVSVLVVATILAPFLPALPVSAEPVPGGTLDPLSIPKYVTPLIVPPEMPETSPGYYEIAVRQFEQQILPFPLPMTTVWSYGSLAAPGTVAEGGTFNYPAFTIEAEYGVPLQVKWVNDLVDEYGNYLPHILPVDQTLHWANPPGGTVMRDMMGTNATPYTGPVPIVTHVHGAHTTEDSDGYPEQWYLPAADNIPAGYAAVGSAYDLFAAKAAALGRVWEPGSSLYEYPNNQRATTLWYHDHTLGMTRLNVYAGPAGFYLIRGGPDDVDLGFNRPGWDLNVGINATEPITDIPLAIQDRSFNDDGSLFFPDNRAFFEGLTPEEEQIPYIPETTIGNETSDVSPIWNPEFFGNTMVVNGNTWPYLEVAQNQYRFRILNGCNSRFLMLELDDGGTFYQIGAEGGFLPSVVPLTRLLIAPAERTDVIIDFSSIPVGTNITMTNVGPDEPFGGGTPGEDFEAADPDTTGQVMQFRVIAATTPDPSTPVGSIVLPEVTAVGPEDGTVYVSLNEVDSATVYTVTDPGTGAITEVAAEEEDAELFGPIQALLGTYDPGTGMTVALHWSANLTEVPPVGSTQLWELRNFTMDAHPIHIHLVQFQVIEREDMTTGNVSGPEPWEMGYKDTVIAYPDQITRVKATFDLAGLFVWHCHIIDHEDNEMMRPYMVYAEPVVNDFAGSTIDEGTAYTSSGNFSAPGLGPWTATVDYGDGSGVQPLALTDMSFDLNHVYADMGVYTVTVNVTDSYSATASNTASVTVNNVAPAVYAGPNITAQSGVPVTVIATFGDPGALDTHNATIDWGDGTIVAGTVAEAAGSGNVTGIHSYMPIGNYTVTVNVTDNHGGLGCDSLVITVERFPVTIDIKPGTTPNAVNLKSKGTFPVAVLSSATFDATLVDPATVVFAAASPVKWTLDDVNMDGFMDMVLQFNAQSTNLKRGDTSATLTAATVPGQMIIGTDSVKVK